MYENEYLSRGGQLYSARLFEVTFKHHSIHNIVFIQVLRSKKYTVEEILDKIIKVSFALTSLNNQAFNRWGPQTEKVALVDHHFTQNHGE